MTDPNKINIESLEGGLLVLKGSDGQVQTTRENLVDALADFADSDKLFVDVQEKKLANKREQYEALKPTGFEYAPGSAVKKREELKSSDNVEKMKWLQDNVSYNADHTINIISLKKTFCEDISGNKETMNFNDAKKLAINTGYKLMTDYNDIDVEEIKKQSDWHKVINLFSGNKGDIVEGMELFRDMAGCNNRYWTATKYKNEKGKELKGVVRYRELGRNDCYRGWVDTGDNGRVCGFKPVP